MRHYLIFGALIAIALAMPVAAQDVQTSQAPALQDVVGGSQPGANITTVLKADRQSPLGARDLLKSYEQDMGTIAMATCQGLSQITSALGQGQITDDQAEYASHQVYAMAMMQFQMLSTLHDILYHKTAKNPEPGSQVDRANVTVLPQDDSGDSRPTVR